MVKQTGVVHPFTVHTGRYFYESRSHDLKRLHYALEHFFAPLYQIEPQSKAQGLTYDKSPETHLESTQVLVNFYTWLQEKLPKVIPEY